MSARIVVFGREPLPGLVKTRLAAEVGPERAALSYRILLEHTLAVARQAGLPTVLCLADPPTGAWRPPPGVEVAQQSSGHLGTRMATAFRTQFDAGATVVVLIGSDTPGVRADDLRDAVAHASEAAVVLGPARDGGYWLVAQRAPGVDLFSGVPWSAPDTLTATLRRLREMGIRPVELGIRSDIDTVADLDTACSHDGIDAELAARLGRALRATGPKGASR